MLGKYFKKLMEMQDLPLKKIQRVRHSLTKLEWSVVNFEIFAAAGWQGKRKSTTMSIPQIDIKLLSSIFKENSDS